jgi:hypothetical protein
MSVHNLTVYPDIRDLLDIPADEPIFIIRAQDRVSVAAIEAYAHLNETEGNDPTFMDNLRQVADQFNHWQVEHSHLVKRAD